MGVLPVTVRFDTGRPGARVYVAGHRWHHGMAGLMCATPAAMILAARHPNPRIPVLVLAAGAVAMWHDRPDFPWLSDRDAYTFR